MWVFVTSRHRQSRTVEKHNDSYSLKIEKVQKRKQTTQKKTLLAGLSAPCAARLVFLGQNPAY